ncbi:DUF2231 domain-containing protein [Acanthopleuribacter pedis]|uniref:DUF2231 domain-containing protein n=1 Tax=Acanthopleuribacter pedis TaxID=442870 RepID=A0A8J7Q7C8_9BACT|nr:DUF2231 domain-containing protein [Acanthopleuribacter pedis]MBO1322012.1 hypothetical protein [Acanthopleuribacter pedis]
MSFLAGWHPFLVHFPIAMWLVGTATLLVGSVAKKESWLGTAWFMLTVAAVTVLPAVWSGQEDIQVLVGRFGEEIVTEGLQDHMDIGNLIPWAMIGMVGLRLHNQFKKQGFKIKNWIWLIWGVAVSIAILYAGVLGGAYVYERAFAAP